MKEHNKSFNSVNKISKIVPDDASAEEIEIEFKNWCKTATGREEKFVS